MENTILNQQNEKEFADELSGITLRYISSVRFVIATRSILELERKVYTWLKIGITGACICRPVYCQKYPTKIRREFSGYYLEYYRPPSY